MSRDIEDRPGSAVKRFRDRDGGYMVAMQPAEERRNAIRYLVLVTLNDAAPESLPLDYRAVAPGIDDFEVRAAASWLVENRYARWATAGFITITDSGRTLIESVRTTDRREPIEDEATAAVQAGGEPVGPGEVEGPNPA